MQVMDSLQRIQAAKALQSSVKMSYKHSVIPYANALRGACVHALHTLTHFRKTELFFRVL
jgi:hypothetical protein